MSRIFTFRVLSDEVDNFVRVYEVSYDMDLLGLHDFICDDLEYDLSNFSSFFTVDSQWNKLQEYTLADMDADMDGDGIVALPMRQTMLSQVVGKVHDRLIFMFDIFAGRSLFMELTAAAEEQESVRYPRVTDSQGYAPAQLSADSLMEEDSPFNDAMEEFAYFEGAADDYIIDEL